MTEFVTPRPRVRRAADYRAAFEELHREMQRAEAQMEDERAQIEALRARSQAITEHTDIVLDQLASQLHALGGAT